MKGKKQNKKSRRKSKLMRGGSKIRISYEQLENMVKKSFEKVKDGAISVQQGVIAAIVLETLNLILNDPSTAQIGYLAATIIGSMFQFAITTLQLTARVTGGMTGTIFSGLVGVSSNTLSGLINSVSGAINVCQTYPTASTALVASATTAVVIKSSEIRNGVQYTIDNGLLNTITYVLFDLMIRSGYFEDVNYNNQLLLETPRNDEVQEIVEEIVQVASNVSSQASSARTSRQTSPQSSQSSSEYEYDYEFSQTNNTNILDAMTLVEDMYQEIAELAKKRSRDIESTLENFQQDAQESSQQCNSQSNKKQRTSSPLYNQDFTNESYQQLASNSLPMPPFRLSPSSRTNSMNSMNSMNDYRGGKTNRRKRTMKKTMKRKTMKKRRKQSRK